MPLVGRARKAATDDDAPESLSALALLASLGEVAYRWSIEDDRIHWDGDIQSVLGIPAAEISTGRRYAALLDRESERSRHEAVFSTSSGTDRGTGVPFRVEYAIRPGGPDRPVVWIEDCGRWYGDGASQPRRVVGIIRVVSDRHEREQLLTFRSSYDELTGFYNRARLIELLEETLVSARRFRNASAFLLLAIDGFRVINDAYGFDVGDQVIAAIAKRVASRLRSGDALGRFSGNKLGVVLRDCGEETMAIVANRFLEVAREEVVATDNGAIAVTISIGGVAIPRSARSVSEATARAEEALFTARRSGHGHFRPFAQSYSLQAERRANAALSNEIIHALGENRFCLAFQPIVDVVSRRPVLQEGLLRLEQGDGSIAEAHSFMPLAERIGLSRLLDQRALELAIAKLKQAPDLILSVNVTADTATEPTWFASLERAVAFDRNLARRLVIEITESTAIRNLDEAIRFVSAVKGIGCSVALDDFGAGYSSFRFLRRLDIDIVKIDGSFVRNLARSEDDRMFVRTLISLARHFGFKTVAEWVQDEETAAMLREWQVDYLQGDLTGKPVIGAVPVRAGTSEASAA